MNNLLEVANEWNWADGEYGNKVKQFFRDQMIDEMADKATVDRQFRIAEKSAQTHFVKRREHNNSMDIKQLQDTKERIEFTITKLQFEKQNIEKLIPIVEGDGFKPYTSLHEAVGNMERVINNLEIYKKHALK